MFGGTNLGLTIHFDKAAPDALEQWLATEARYIIGTYAKPADLQKVYGPKTDSVIADCKRLGDSIISGITMILDGDLKKLHMTLVRLQNGDSFLIDSKYALVKNDDTAKLVNELLQEDGPRVFSVTSK